MCTHVAAILKPLPDPPRPDDDPSWAEVGYAEVLDEVHRERQQLAEALREGWGHDVDPVLVEISTQRERMLQAERTMRLLIAYAREYVRPRPYRLEDLAVAAGMSISGVRTAYDDDEIEQVAELTGQRPRRATPTEEARPGK
jgi:hypothetical protein